MPEVRILLQRPASLTPELRAWIGNRLGSGKVALTRSRMGNSGRSTVLMRVEVQADSERAMEEEIADLLTDLRLLGLRPTQLSEQAV